MEEFEALDAKEQEELIPKACPILVPKLLNCLFCFLLFFLSFLISSPMPMNEGPVIEWVFGQDYLDFLCSATGGPHVRAIVMYGKFRGVEAADDARLQIVSPFPKILRNNELLFTKKKISRIF